MKNNKHRRIRSHGLAGLLLCASLPTAVLAQVQNTTYSYQYDNNGNLTRITDPLGRVTNQSYDALNRLKQQLQPAPAADAARPVISYDYNGQGRLVSVTDPRNLVTSYTLDGLGNQTAIASPDTGTANKTYDALGNLKTVTDARGKTTTYQYDAINRITSISYATGAATLFEYDGGTSGAPNAISRLTRITDESGQTNYVYDAAGRLINQVQTVSGGATTNYYAVDTVYGTNGNSNGKRISLTYPSGNRIGYTYDNAGRIHSLTLTPATGATAGTAVPLLLNIGYAPFGDPTNWTWGNSSSTAQNSYARGYDLDGRLVSYPMGNGVVNGMNVNVTYDAASRLTGTTHSGTGSGSMASANFNQTFSYDNLDRLTGFTGSSTSQAYQYDATGNRTQVTFGATNYTNAIAATSNRMTSAAGPTPARSYTYDAAGNRTGDGSTTYLYSDRGRLKSITNAGGTVNYLYNGWGPRVRKSGPSSIIATGVNDYVYDEQGHLLGEYNANGRPIQETVYLNDLPVAVLKPVTVTDTSTTPPTATTSTAVYYVYADQLNTPRVITEASDNQIVWRWDNADPFGMFAPDGDPSGFGVFVYNLRFAGQYFDKETNLFYNGYRYYDPQTGRYLQSDPIGLAGGLLSTYAYVDNQPTRYADPNGLQLVIPAGGGTAAAGGAAAGGGTGVNGNRGGYDPKTDTYLPPSVPASINPLAILCRVAPLACLAGAIANEVNQDEGKNCPIPGGTGGERVGKGPRKWDMPPSDDPVGDANRDFDNKFPNGDWEDKGNGVRVGIQPDGKRVIIRPESSDRSGNVPTIEIQNPSGSKSLDKIRYPRN